MLHMCAEKKREKDTNVSYKPSYERFPPGEEKKVTSELLMFGWKAKRGGTSFAATWQQTTETGMTPPESHFLVAFKAPT